MPELTARWAQRQRPIPASVVYARQQFEQIWAADGSVLEALFRKLKSLQDCPAGQLAGKICTLSTWAVNGWWRSGSPRMPKPTILNFWMVKDRPKANAC